MRTLRRLNQSGMTLAEVLAAVALLSIGLLAILSMLGSGVLAVQNGGNQSKATAFARQQLESLINAPFTPGPVNGADIPEGGVTRTWTIAPVGASPTPNRLARITVTVVATPGAGQTAFQSITLETMRAE